MDHRLTQLFLLIDILNQVRLIHYIDQMPRFGHTPEYLAHAHQPGPGPAKMLPIGLSYIPVSAIFVVSVISVKRDDCDAITPFAPNVAELRRDDRRWRLALFWILLIGRFIKKIPGLKRCEAGQIAALGVTHASEG